MLASLIWAIVWIIIGWFIFDRVPSMVNATGTLSTVIKIIGIIVMIGGVLDLVGAFI